MKYFFHPNQAATPTEKQFIRENYGDNIVFQWLKLPCLTYCKPNGLLTHEDLFCLSFQFLDFLKQHNDHSDCMLHNELQCIPYEIARHWDKYTGNQQQWVTETLLAILTLCELLQIVVAEDDEEDTVLYHPEKSLSCNIYKIFPNCSKEHVSSVITDIDCIFTTKSPIYRHSSKIMLMADDCEAEKPHLIDYILGYMVSQQRISEEIETAQTATAQPSDNASKKETQELEQLREELKKKELEIKELKEQTGNTPAQPIKGSIEIPHGYKERITALLSAMYYAHFFIGKDGISNRDDVLTHILKYGFHYETHSISEMLSQFETNTEGLERLRKELNDALDQLPYIRKPKQAKEK